MSIMASCWFTKYFTKGIMKFIFKLLVTGLIFGFIIYQFDINILKAFGEIQKYKYLCLALLVPLIVNPIISNNRWKFFLSIQGIDEKFKTLLKMNFIAVFLGFLLPSSTGFDSIRIYQIEKRHKIKLGAGGASVIAERLIGFYLLSLLGLLCAIYALQKGIPQIIFFTALFFHVLIILILLTTKNKYAYLKITTWLIKLNRFKNIANYLQKLYTALHKFPLFAKLKLTIPLILMQQIASVACALLLFKAFGIDLPIFIHFAFVPLILILSIIPVSISGFGIREGFFVYFYSLVGVESHISLMVSLLYYSLMMLIPAAIGMVLYLIQSDLKEDDLNTIES